MPLTHCMTSVNKDRTGSGSPSPLQSRQMDFTSVYQQTQQHSAAAEPSQSGNETAAIPENFSAAFDGDGTTSAGSPTFRGIGGLPTQLQPTAAPSEARRPTSGLRTVLEQFRSTPPLQQPVPPIAPTTPTATSSTVIPETPLSAMPDQQATLTTPSSGASDAGLEATRDPGLDS